jgi:hypothetical protein
MSGVIEKVVADYFEIYDENYYKFMRERYPEFANQWIEETELKKRIAVELITLASQGMPYTKIAQKVNAPYKLVLKFGQSIYSQYASIVNKNAHKLKEVAGDTRTPRQIEDYNYMNHPRTIRTEMNVLLPRIDEIRSLIHE